MTSLSKILASDLTKVPPPIDVTIGDMGTNAFAVLAGRSGTGKTAMALQLALNFGGSVVFNNLEMTEEQLGQRLLANMSAVHQTKIKYGENITEEEYSRMAYAAQELDKRTFEITSARTAQGMIKAVHKHEPDLFIVDYAQLTRGDEDKKSHEQLESVVEALQRLAQDTETTIVLLSQLKTITEPRRAEAGDLAASRSLEWYAELIAILERGEKTNQREIYTAKSRHDAVGTVRSFTFIGETLTFIRNEEEEVQKYVN